jgi:hypothetical protein
LVDELIIHWLHFFLFFVLAICNLHSDSYRNGIGNFAVNSGSQGLAVVAMKACKTALVIPIAIGMQVANLQERRDLDFAASILAATEVCGEHPRNN